MVRIIVIFFSLLFVINWTTSCDLNTSEYSKFDKARWPQLVKLMYAGNTKNYLPIINEISKLLNQNDKNYANEVFFQELKENGHLYTIPSMVLAFNLQSNGDENQYKTMQAMPESIKLFPYKGRLLIRNVAFGEFLYVGGNSLMLDSERRRIFTWAGGRKCIEDECFWNVTRSERHPDFVTITNKGYGKNLYAENDKFQFDSTRRNVFVSDSNAPQEADEWQLEPVDDTKYFRIKNRYWDEYLYAEFDNQKYDVSKRRVVTWKPYGCDGSTCQWEFLKGSSY